VGLGKRRKEALAALDELLCAPASRNQGQTVVFFRDVCLAARPGPRPELCELTAQRRSSCVFVSDGSAREVGEATRCIWAVHLGPLSRADTDTAMCVHMCSVSPPPSVPPPAAPVGTPTPAAGTGATPASDMSHYKAEEGVLPKGNNSRCRWAEARSKLLLLVLLVLLVVKSGAVSPSSWCSLLCARTRGAEPWSRPGPRLMHSSSVRRFLSEAACSSPMSMMPNRPWPIEVAPRAPVLSLRVLK